MKNRSVLALVGAVVACSGALADDYESGIIGRQIYPIRSKHIRMARERVEIFVEWPDEQDYHARARVRAQFVLVNDSESPQSILVAFPGAFVKGESLTRKVDGEPVEVKRYRRQDGWDFDYTSRVDFRPRQARTVAVAYMAEFAAQGGMGGGDWTYILTTGALWKGTIGDIRVTVHFPMDMPPGGLGPFDVSGLQLSPEGYVADGRTVTWHMRNVEPDENINIVLDPFRALLASDPLRLASREEAPGLLLALGRALPYHEWKHSGATKEALKVFADLLREFPDSWEARNSDFYLAQVYAHRYVSGGHIIGRKLDPHKAAHHYEAALKTDITEEQRDECLWHLIELYTLDIAKPVRAAELVDLLAERLRLRSDNIYSDTYWDRERMALISSDHTLRFIDGLDQRPAERAAMLETLARHLADGIDHRDTAISLYEALRRRFPECYLSAHGDYHRAPCHCEYFVHEGRAGHWGSEPAKAVECYEKALKSDLPRQWRRRALTQLFALYSLDAADPAGARRMLDILSREHQLDPLDWDADEPGSQDALEDPCRLRLPEEMDLVAAISPADALALLDSMRFHPACAEAVAELRAQLAERVRRSGAPNRTAAYTPPTRQD